MNTANKIIDIISVLTNNIRKYRVRMYEQEDCGFWINWIIDNKEYTISNYNLGSSFVKFMISGEKAYGIDIIIDMNPYKEQWDAVYKDLKNALIYYTENVLLNEINL